MEKISIKNRNNQTIVVGLDILPTGKGLAFIAHGRSGFKEEPHIQTLTDAFLEAHYSVVRWDATNTMGESDGDIQEATPTNYYEDLQDVIHWSQTQKWYVEPFILAGHSLGAMISTLYAEKHSSKVKALVPVSTSVSGKQFKGGFTPAFLKNWKEKGYREIDNESNGKKYRLKWHYLEDYQRYDLLPNIAKLTMPVLLITGEKDDGYTPANHNALLDVIPSENKELHIIPGASHVFQGDKQLSLLKKQVIEWLNTFD